MDSTHDSPVNSGSPYTAEATPGVAETLLLGHMGVCVCVCVCRYLGGRGLGLGSTVRIGLGGRTAAGRPGTGEGVVEEAERGVGAATSEVGLRGTERQASRRYGQMEPLARQERGRCIRRVPRIYSRSLTTFPFPSTSIQRPRHAQSRRASLPNSIRHDV